MHLNLEKNNHNYLKDKLFEDKNQVYRINDSQWNFYDYVIYCNGKIWSKKRNKFLSIQPVYAHGKNPYDQKVFCINKNTYKIKVHRLIAQFFIDNPLNKQYVNHLNGITLDNCKKNLEWVTPKENVTHARKELNSFPSKNKSPIYHTESGYSIKAIPCCLDDIYYNSLEDALTSVGYKSKSIFLIDRLIKENRLIVLNKRFENAKNFVSPRSKKCLLDGKEFTSINKAILSIGKYPSGDLTKRLLKSGRLVVINDEKILN